VKTLYIDILFFINASMDALSLYLTSTLTHTRARPLRLIFAAFLGAVYGVIAVVYPGDAAVNFLLSVAVSALLVYIAFACTGKAYVKLLLYFYGISLLLGGCVTALYCFNGNLLGDTEISPVKSDLLLFFAALSGTFITAAEKYFVKKFRGKSIALEVSLTHNVSRTFSALVDSGNLLCDPILSRQVILIGKKHAASLLPPAYRFPDEGGKTPPYPHPIFIHDSGGTRMIWAFSPSYVKLWEGKSTTEITASVGIDTQNESFGGCDALFPESLLL